MYSYVLFTYDLMFFYSIKSKFYADLIEDKRWAIIIIVNEFLLLIFDYYIYLIASWTSFSLYGSKALVASSKIKICGFLRRALAIAILYF